MPRNGSGTYNLPALNPVVSGTTVASGWANNTMADLGNEITNSLPVDGQKPMAAPLKLADGIAASPALQFNSETASGLYRSGTNDLRFAIAGADIFKITPTGLNSVNLGATTAGTGAFTTLAASGATTLASTLAVTGNTTVTGTLTTGAISTAASVTITGPSIELGRTATSGTTFIDFHSSGTASDYDSRIYATGGSSTAGLGSLFVAAGNISLIANTTVSGTVTASNFSGPGTSLTGTAGSLNIGGNSGTSTLAASATRNQNAVQFLAAGVASSTDTTATSNFMTQNNGGTGDSNLSAISFHCVSQYGIKMHLRADGYFGIGGWSSPAWRWYSDPTGNMTASGDITAYSDPRLKKNVKNIPNALDKIQTLNGVNFTWKSKKWLHKGGTKDVGVLANQVKSIMPEAVTTGMEHDGVKYDMVAYDKLIPLLIEGIKELRAEVIAIKSSQHRYD